jgi:hypothetical protein
VLGSPESRLWGAWPGSPQGEPTAPSLLVLEEKTLEYQLCPLHTFRTL